ncbi:hypothetical protein QNM97_21360 [Gordonia sp. L191]|uniref:hypothetical protein n=1 Tax=Gordonia sp. L191 TaxID=2982699 RepID=UPI0024C0A4F2|nr:hypothetical protein [Gordonia sp. L191]WHU46504.1 hypothetical protein QNM97_21360 [Gordonia sp. L191]
MDQRDGAQQRQALRQEGLDVTSGTSSNGTPVANVTDPVTGESGQVATGQSPQTQQAVAASNSQSQWDQMTANTQGPEVSGRDAAQQRQALRDQGLAVTSGATDSGTPVANVTDPTTGDTAQVPTGMSPATQQAVSDSQGQDAADRQIVASQGPSDATTNPVVAGAQQRISAREQGYAVTATVDDDGNPINVYTDPTTGAQFSVRATGNDLAQAFTDQLTAATSMGPYTSPEAQQTAQGAQTRTGLREQGLIVNTGTDPVTGQPATTITHPLTGQTQYTGTNPDGTTYTINIAGTEQSATGDEGGASSLFTNPATGEPLDLNGPAVTAAIGAAQQRGNDLADAFRQPGRSHSINTAGLGGDDIARIGAAGKVLGRGSFVLGTALTVADEWGKYSRDEEDGGDAAAGIVGSLAGGTLGGAAAGAAIGTFAGPIGTAVGAGIGAAVGSQAGADAARWIKGLFD